MIKMEINDAEVRRVLSDIGKYKKEVVEGVKKQIVTSTYNIKNDAYMRAPKKTTYLVHSIKAQIAGNRMNGEVSANADYAEAVEKGTRPHIIAAKNKPLLKFKIDGQWIAKREVHHPGTRPHPFMSPAFEKEKPVFINKILTLIRRK